MTTSRQQYIDRYAEFAMLQMRRYGIPASITLAQGIIESADGRSTLADTANNHFGIKGTYNGNYVLADDDRRDEKFRKYDNVSQSYEDHSKILMAQRYQKYVGNLAPDDYKGWAAGIKKGGYASDANYFSTLINVIESSDLQRFDQMVMKQMKAEGKQFGVKDNPLPGGSAQTQGSALGANLPDGSYSMPVERSEFMLVTSPYGKRDDPVDKGKTQMHHGIDIKTDKDAVLATEDNGVIVGVDHRTTTAGGKTVTVEYSRNDGTKTRVQYMHLSEITVKKGDTVNAGQKLGVSGNTGTRTTGEHLHLGVINVSAGNKLQWVNPAAYLAGISQKGKLNIEVLHNGKDLLAEYKSSEVKAEDKEQQTPEGWMSRLLGSDDAALGMRGDNGNGLLGGLMQMFMMLLMLAVRMENSGKEEKMQAVSDALVNRRIDLSSLVPNQKSAVLTVNDKGNATLTVNDGRHEYSHELTDAEKNNISNILGSDSDDATKKQRIGCAVNAIAFSCQASENYEQMEAQQQSRQQDIQRK